MTDTQTCLGPGIAVRGGDSSRSLRSRRPPFKMRLGLRSVRRLELASWRVVNAVFDASHKIFAAGMALATCAGPRTRVA